MKINHFPAKTLGLQAQYRKLYARLHKAIAAGRFARWAAAKQQTLLARLRRYEARLTRYGMAVASAATLLLGAAPVQAQQPVPVGGEFRVNSYTSNTQTGGAVAMDSDGDFVIAWASLQDGSGGGIYAQRYNAAGAAQGSEFRVNTYTTLNQYSPSIAMDSDGDFVIAWQSDGQDGSSDGIYAQRYNAAGTAQGGEFRVNTYITDSQSYPCIAINNDGDFVIAWESEDQDDSSSGIYAQRYNAAGVAQGSEFRVNTYTTYSQFDPSIAMDSDGDFVIAWEGSEGQDGSNLGIYAQRYNAAGVAVGGEFQVNTYTTYNQGKPSVAMDSDGDFVVAWTGIGQDGFGIYAQRYNAAGAAQGGEFQVNTYTTHNQLNPSIAMDSDGDFVIAWESIWQDGSWWGIYARRYNAAGAAQGSEFRVNTYTTQDQEFHCIAMESDGDFVIAWDSYGQDGSNYGIYAQRYTLTPTATDPQHAPTALQLSPNPTTGLLTVGLTALPGAALRLYDALGREQVVPQTITAADQLQLDLSRLPAGMYLLRAGAQSARVVKE